MYRKIGTIAVNDITRNVKHLSRVYIDVYVVAQNQHGTAFVRYIREKVRFED